VSGWAENTFLLVGSCVLAAVQLVGTWFCEGPAARRVVGWRLMLVSVALAAVYNTITGQWGFLVQGFILVGIRHRNLRLAKQEAAKVAAG